MSQLFTTTDSINIALANHLSRLLGSLESEARDVNAMTAALLSAPNQVLTEWLRSKADQLQKIFTDHATVGAACNASIAAVQRQMGLPETAPCDVRPVHEKLAEQFRAIDWKTLEVCDLPRPAPEPETASAESTV